MGKILTLILGMGVVFGVAYYATHNVGGVPGQTPQQALSNARSAAQRIEQDAQRRADDLARKTEREAP